MHGQEVCHAHGGRAPQNLEAARRRAEQAKVEGTVADLLARFDLADAPDPAEALLGLLADAWRWRQAVEVLVAALDVGELAEHPLVRLRTRAVADQREIAEACARANIDERRLQLDEDQRDRLFAAVVRALEQFVEQLGVRLAGVVSDGEREALAVWVPETLQLLLVEELRRGALPAGEAA